MSSIPNQIVKFRTIVNGYKISQVIMTLEKNDVFKKIVEGANEIDELSKAVNIPEGKLSVLLNALVHYGLLVKIGQKYSFSDEFIVINPKHPASQNGYIRFSENARDKWLYLSSCLSEDNKNDMLNKITGGDPLETRNFISAMHVNAIPQAKYIIENYDFDRRSILDIGAGSGIYSTVVGERYISSTGVLYELPGVSEITKEYLSKSGICERFNTITGDYHQALPEGKFSDVFLFAVIHQESDEELFALLSRIRAVLKPGGRLFLTSFFLEEDRITPLFPVMFSVEMLVMHDEGKVYTFKEVEKILSTAGFNKLQRIDEVPGPATLYIASV